MDMSLTPVAEVSGNVVIEASVQADLTTFIQGSAFAELDIDIQGGLHAAAAGGACASLSVEVQASLTAWIQSSDCTLDDSLKVSIQAWISGEVSTGTENGVDPSTFGMLPSDLRPPDFQRVEL